MGEDEYGAKVASAVILAIVVYHEHDLPFEYVAVVHEAARHALEVLARLNLFELSPEKRGSWGLDPCHGSWIRERHPSPAVFCALAPLCFVGEGMGALYGVAADVNVDGGKLIRRSQTNGCGMVDERGF